MLFAAVTAEGLADVAGRMQNGTTNRSRLAGAETVLQRLAEIVGPEHAERIIATVDRLDVLSDVRDLGPLLAPPAGVLSRV